jgi:cytochrome c553
MPCGYCHLPDGRGRPENASLAGLPAPYIVAQVEAMRAGSRVPAVPGWLPSQLMIDSVHDLTEADIGEAARYFWELDARPAVSVVEASTVPAHGAACFVEVPRPGPPAALGKRILELPLDVERFERRDPRAEYVAYVPPGSIARGRALAESGRPGKTPSCSSCHGPELRGAMDLTGPPLAGRFPHYLFRQLVGFREGARRGPATAPMQAVAATLSDEDFIDAAAYAASLVP